MKVLILQLYLVISQLLLEQSSFLAVTRGLLHGSSDVLQSLLCLALYAKQNTLFIFYNLMIPDDPSSQTSKHVAADFQLSSASISSGAKRVHKHPIRPQMTACLVTCRPVGIIWGAEYLTSFELNALLLGLFRQCVYRGSSSCQLAQTSLYIQPAHRLSKSLEMKRNDYAFRRQFNEKSSVTPGCPQVITRGVTATINANGMTACHDVNQPLRKR